MSTEIATALEQRVADSINAERAAAGLPALKVEAHLNSAAQAHSDWMGTTENFSHTGEDGSSAVDRIGDSGFPLTGSWRIAENIAYASIDGHLGDEEVDRMHEGLMQSPEHKANMLDPDVSYVGIGLSIGSVTTGGVGQDAAYLTEDFGESDGRVLVQEEQGGETVLQPYVEGEPDGDPQPVDVPPDDDTGNPDDPQQPDDGDQQDGDQVSTAGCFVATAAYGSYDHPDVVALRRFKDEVLDRNAAGRAFVDFYWIVGPKLARHVSTAGRSGRAARALIAPLARLARRRRR